MFYYHLLPLWGGLGLGLLLFNCYGRMNRINVKKAYSDITY